MSSVGELIDAYCLRCKLTLSHVILYESGGKVDKVKCRTCGAEHKYRGPKPSVKSGDERVKRPKSSQKGASSSSRSGREKAPLRVWTEKSEALRDETSIRDYSIHESFHAGDVIRHSTFGIGFVERIISENRMDVLFEDALRRMAMNM